MRRGTPGVLRRGDFYAALARRTASWYNIRYRGGDKFAQA